MHKPVFSPAWWLPGPHLQTLWAAWFKRTPRKALALKRERLELADGDFIDLDWAHTPHHTAPIVVILHGLEGSSKSAYAQGLLSVLSRSFHWRPVVMHFRGCSGEPNRAPRLYHSGETGDIAAVIRTLKQREPHIPIAAIGVSIGGNVLLKWLGETGADNPLVAAVAVSTPFELAKSTARLQWGFSRWYERHLLKNLKATIIKKCEQTAHSFDLDKIKQLETIKAFDDYITAPMHGFLGADDYYAKCSSRQFVKQIATPTLILHAKDDPFMSPDAIPESSELPSHVTLEVTDKGGHVGFVMGRFPWSAQYWLEQRIPAFFAPFLKG